MTGTKLGFIGLGNMGSAMSARLVDAGHDLLGFDPAGTEERLPAGGVAAASVEDVVRRAEIVFLSLPDGRISQVVCQQIRAASDKAVRLVIDLSTIGIESARACAALLSEDNIIHLDAPVSGGVAGAQNGTLAMMIGGPREDYEAVDHLLSPIAKNRFHMGNEAGMGQAMKLLNNVVSAASLVITSESVAFGEQVGLDMAKMVDVLNVSSGRTSASLEKFPRSIIGKTYDYGFSGQLMTKDVLLYLENARTAGVADEAASCIGDIWERFNDRYPTADFTYLYEWVRNREG